jgi:predicted amidohydrolase YtcJ
MTKLTLMQSFRLSVGLLLGSFAAFAADAPADLIVVNGKVLTVDANNRRASAVAIKEGKFVAVGSDADIRKLAGPQTRTIDARQRTVVPGLIESHVHATGAARVEANVPFRQLHSIGEIQDWVRERAKSLPPGSWIALPRVDVTRIKERRIPNRADLDAAAPNNPAVFTWQYGSKTVQRLNSKAIAAAGITKDTQPPPRGKIHLDEKGEPTGVLDDASALLTKFMPARAVSDEKYQDLLATLLKRYNEIGITSITERGSNADGYRTYQKLRDDGRLPLRVTVTHRLVTDGSVEATEQFIKSLPYKTGDGDDWVRVGPLKVSIDGGALYGTAYMREPYGPQAFSLYGISDPQYRGKLEISPEKLKNIFRTVHRMGWQMSTHVTGDAGVDHALDALEAANADSPVAPRRYNLIHGYFPNPETAKRVARLGAVVDTQPMWFYKDGDALLDALGQKRMEQFIGLRTWRDAGVKVALNADHMQGFDPDTSLNPYNPFLAMQAAVTRKTESGKVIGAHQKISREEALRMFTIDAAWMSFDETRKGSIEVGKFGDLAILTGDFLAIPEDKLNTLRAQVTIVGGKVVHERK